MACNQLAGEEGRAENPKLRRNAIGRSNLRARMRSTRKPHTKTVCSLSFEIVVLDLRVGGSIPFPARIFKSVPPAAPGFDRAAHLPSEFCTLIGTHLLAC